MNSRQRIVIDARPSGEDMPSDADGMAIAASENKIVSLFAEPDAAGERRPAEPDAIDWPAAIDLIRNVGARVRRANDFAQEMSRHSQSIIQRSVKQTEEAEQRAAAAEAKAASAIARAERSEELARLSEARATLAERQAEAARAAEAEARRWLGRVLGSLKDEFKGIADDPL